MSSKPTIFEVDVDQIPRIIKEVTQYIHFQLAGGVRAGDIFNSQTASRSKALEIRKRFAKKKRTVDLSKYKPSEVAYALKTFMSDSHPLIPTEFYACFTAALALQKEHSASCFQGLVQQLLHHVDGNCSS